MKKIFAILMSLLFVVSVFGVASVAAPCNLPDDITVRVGDTFTLESPCPICDGNYLEDTYLGDGVHQYKAIKSGKVKFCTNCGYPEYCATITILPKYLPMDFFMKIFGFGKKK